MDYRDSRFSPCNVNSYVLVGVSRQDSYNQMKLFMFLYVYILSNHKYQ